MWWRELGGKGNELERDIGGGILRPGHIVRRRVRCGQGCRWRARLRGLELRRGLFGTCTPFPLAILLREACQVA